MARANADDNVPTVTRDTFAFLNDDEVSSVFESEVEDFEDDVDDFVTGVPNSPERAVLFSLAYNNILYAAESPSLQRAQQ